LSAADRVLDLGCASGSFRDVDCTAIAIRADLHIQAASVTRGVCCDAAHLPFADRSFAALILNHSLEHFEKLDEVLNEVGRVIQKTGRLYVAVPDSRTITDRLYRWLGRGGGHVNQFSDLVALQRLIEKKTGLTHRGTRVLFSSLSFLNRNNCKGAKPRRMYLLGGGSERLLRIGTFLARKVDSLAGTRTSLYGWALYFGSEVSLTTEAWSNVCIRCGSGHPSSWLTSSGAVQTGLAGIRKFRCSTCGVINYFTEDQDFAPR
jgi:hypothetical protein